MVVLCSRCKKKFDACREPMWQVQFLLWNYPIVPNPSYHRQIYCCDPLEEERIAKFVLLCDRCRGKVEDELIKEEEINE